jgi:hypothetical protein
MVMTFIPNEELLFFFFLVVLLWSSSSSSFFYPDEMPSMVIRLLIGRSSSLDLVSLRPVLCHRRHYTLPAPMSIAGPFSFLSSIDIVDPEHCGD